MFLSWCLHGVSACSGERSCFRHQHFHTRLRPHEPFARDHARASQSHELLSSPSRRGHSAKHVRGTVATTQRLIPHLSLRRRRTRTASARTRPTMTPPRRQLSRRCATKSRDISQQMLQGGLQSPQRTTTCHRPFDGLLLAHAW